MSIVTVDDVMADPELREMASPELLSVLKAAYENARTRRQDVRERRSGYTLLVNRHGDIRVEIERFGGFENWVRDAGELALHVGPSHDPNTSATVVGLLDAQDQMPRQEPARPALDDEPGDGDEDGEDNEPEEPPSWRPGLAPLHWAGWSPRLSAANGGVPADLTVDVDQVVWAWRCDSCGAASVDADDFEAIPDDPGHRRCECGGGAARTAAVYCASCDTLILLRSTDPDVPAPA
ncbi:MAG: hypothetical protein ABSA40_01030 [Candidatus Dormibacteria bacterium]|jgi:hypothetical protein